MAILASTYLTAAKNVQPDDHWIKRLLLVEESNVDTQGITLPTFLRIHLVGTELVKESDHAWFKLDSWPWIYYAKSNKSLNSVHPVNARDMNKCAIDAKQSILDWSSPFEWYFYWRKKAIINGMTATDISLYCDMSGPVEEGRSTLNPRIQTAVSLRHDSSARKLDKFNIKCQIDIEMNQIKAITARNTSGIFAGRFLVFIYDRRHE